MLDNAVVAKAATGDRRVAGMLVLSKDASSYRGWCKRSCALDKASAAHAKGSEAVQTTAGDQLLGILPSTGGHHDCVIIPTELEHMKHTRSCTL